MSVKISSMYRESGMKRMLQYHHCIHEKGEMAKVYNHCEKFCGEQHDYHECTECPAFQMYCELEEFRFAASFD